MPALKYDNTVKKNIPHVKQKRAIPQKRISKRRSHKAKLYSISIISFFVFSSAILTVTVFLIHYLNLRSECNQIDKSIYRLEEEYEKIIKNNKQMENELKTYQDLDEIYRKAVGEYGMVFPNKNETILYEAPDEGYVRQYAEIP